jgi:hypothetical protein
MNRKNKFKWIKLFKKKIKKYKNKTNYKMLRIIIFKIKIMRIYKINLKIKNLRIKIIKKIKVKKK